MITTNGKGPDPVGAFRFVINRLLCYTVEQAVIVVRQRYKYLTFSGITRCVACPTAIFDFGP